MANDDKNPSPKAIEKNERDARLSEALRENLRRRKQQARDKKATDQQN